MNGKIDFFISYTSKDSLYATWIATILESNGYRVFIQAWDIGPGDNITEKINEGLMNCDKMIALISRSYCESIWCTAEWTSMYYDTKRNKRKKIIPIIIEPVNIEGLLAPLCYIDIIDCTKEKTEQIIKKELFEEASRTPQGIFPVSYSVEHIEIKNVYRVYDSFIIYEKHCKTKILEMENEKTKIHSRITWFPDEKVDITSLTEGVSIEMIDDHDTNINFFLVFDHVLEAGEEVSFSFRAKISNIHKHFQDFFATEIITPLRRLSYQIEFDSLKNIDVYTQVLADSPMNKSTEVPVCHKYTNPFLWSVDNPKLHYEYKVFWEKKK